MGWSKGKGLGMNEDGQQNFIRVSHKTDQKGMGYQDRDDQWTGHESNFNSLLESLHNSKSTSENEEASDEHDEQETSRTGFGFASDEKKTKKSKSIKDKLSGKSLEEMSKQSGVRVHYRKFTRGKDISKYSEKDLANIFGKKCIDGDVVEKTEEKPEMDEKEEIHENILGFKSIETGISVYDYFKTKRDKTNTATVMPPDESITDAPENKRRKKDKDRETEPIERENTNIEESNESVAKKEKKKKKKSKKDADVEQPYTNEAIMIPEEDSDCEMVVIELKKKKKKSKKSSDEMQHEPRDEPTIEDSKSEDIMIECVEKGNKKKKRDKKRSNETITASSEVNLDESLSISNTQFLDGILNILVNNRSTHSSTALNKSNAEHDNETSKIASSQSTGLNVTMDEVFEINRYHAEMFRFVDLDGFPNANLSELSGYGYGKDFELKISEKSKDQNKINDLWDYALINKYGKEVIQAKKAKRYSIKHLKKKNLFVGV